MVSLMTEDMGEWNINSSNYVDFGAIQQLLKLYSNLNHIENSLADPPQINRLKIFKGILNGKKTFTGPAYVEICISNFCNMNCLACWQYSPLIKEKYPPHFDPKKKNQMMTFRLFKKIVDDLNKLGVQTIRITSRGEPLFNPEVIDMIKYVKEKNIFCSINTNGALITKDLVKKFCKIGLDQIDLSVWAGSAKTYAKTRPNQNEKTFFDIKDWLHYLADIKGDYKNKPSVVLVNVIFNKNYNDLENMAKFAIETKINSLFFGAADLKNDTEELLLNSKELVILKNKIKNCLSLLKNMNIPHNLHEFYETINSTGALRGKFDLDMSNKYPCYHGWMHSRINTDGIVSPCGFTDLIMGNLKKNSFIAIWNSKKYIEFREKCLSNLHDKYFSTSFCNYNCVYFRVNQRMHNGVTIVKKNYLKKLQSSSPQRALQLWLKEIDPILEKSFVYRC